MQISDTFASFSYTKMKKKIIKKKKKKTGKNKKEEYKIKQYAFSFVQILHVSDLNPALHSRQESRALSPTLPPTDKSSTTTTIHQIYIHLQYLKPTHFLFTLIYRHEFYL